PVDRHAECGERRAQCGASLAVPEIKVLICKLTDEPERAHVGLAKPCAFLAAQGKHPHGLRRDYSGLAIVLKHQQTRDDAGESIEVAALWHGVEMRAD